MSEHVVRAVIDRRGRGTIEIDGVDVSEFVESIKVESHSLTRPEIVVAFSPSTLDLTIVGDVRAETDLHVEGGPNG